MKLQADKVDSVLKDARIATTTMDRGHGAYHAAGYARGAIETLKNLGLLSAREFSQLEHTVMVAEADADLASELQNRY